MTTFDCRIYFGVFNLIIGIAYILLMVTRDYTKKTVHNFYLYWLINVAYFAWVIFSTYKIFKL